MGLLLKLHLSSYATRNTLGFGITTNVIVLFLPHVIVLYTASVYVNGKCKHKHIGSFLHV